MSSNLSRMYLFFHPFFFFHFSLFEIKVCIDIEFKGVFLASFSRFSTSSEQVEFMSSFSFVLSASFPQALILFLGVIYVCDVLGSL